MTVVGARHGEPSYLAEVRGRLRDSRVAQYGVQEAWLMPAASYEAQNGFGEETWLPAVASATVSWRTAGAAIRCHWGPRKGHVGETGRPLISLTPGGAPSAWTAHGAIAFSHFAIPDVLAKRIGDELDLQRFDASALRDDLVFFEDDELFRSLTNYVDRAAAASRPTRLEMEARAVLIVDHLIRTYHADGLATIARGGLAPYQLRRVRDFIEANLSQEIALTELADLADLSASHFCRAFKHSVGLPPHGWLVIRRLERAQELMLAYPQMGLIEIALSVGYQSQSAFGTAFKRATGTTPHQWRRERLR